MTQMPSGRNRRRPVRTSPHCRCHPERTQHDISNREPLVSGRKCQRRGIEAQLFVTMQETAGGGRRPIVMPDQYVALAVLTIFHWNFIRHITNVWSQKLPGCSFTEIEDCISPILGNLTDDKTIIVKIYSVLNYRKQPSAMSM